MEQRANSRRSTLTPREREVVKMIAEGNSAREIAGVLGLSVKTVEAHRFNLMRKLDIHNRAQLGDLRDPEKNCDTCPQRLKPARFFNIYFIPFGYTRILLASPVFKRSIALEKSFIAMRSVITGCRSSLPFLSSAVI